MIDIVPVLEHFGATYVPEGRNRPLKCPFHDDHIKSGSVDTDRGVYNCHTCGVKGDAIAIIQTVEGLGFKDAQQRAAQIAGGGDSDVRGSVSREPGSFLHSRKGDRPSRRSYLPSWKRRDPS